MTFSALQSGYNLMLYVKFIACKAAVANFELQFDFSRGPREEEWLPMVVQVRL